MLPQPDQGFWQSLLDRLLPPRCVLCGCPVVAACLCGNCSADLPWTGVHCRQCGLPLTRSGDEICGRCVRRPPPFTGTISPLLYEYPVDRLVRAFKFRHQQAAGRALGQLLCRWVRTRDCALPDALVPVPLHRWRLFQRGFNQSCELANVASKALGIPLLAADLRRARHTAAQSGLNRAQRRSNVRGAFYWHAWGRAPRHVALVDDVMTTGTTASECARVLKRAGARRVDVWVAARAIGAPPGGRQSSSSASTAQRS